ncbi:MAG TPA: hypothetical protein V6C85_33215 [Allocoleopsis sp.]
MESHQVMSAEELEEHRANFNKLPAVCQVLDIIEKHDHDVTSALDEILSSLAAERSLTLEEFKQRHIKRIVL